MLQKQCLLELDGKNQTIKFESDSCFRGTLLTTSENSKMIRKGNCAHGSRRMPNERNNTYYMAKEISNFQLDVQTYYQMSNNAIHYHSDANNLDSSSPECFNGKGVLCMKSKLIFFKQDSITSFCSQGFVELRENKQKIFIELYNRSFLCQQHNLRSIKIDVLLIGR